MNNVKWPLLFVCGCAIVLLATSTGGNYWLVVDGASEGLWMYCPGNSKCRPFNLPLGTLKNKMQATRAFAILAILSSLAAGVLTLLGFFSEKVKGTFVSVFAGGAAVCMIIALAIFTDLTSDITKSKLINYGWSYILGWVGVFGTFNSCILGFFAK
ncbi:lens fiber membrane intrinsic protein-like [Clytia hemisphaerica]|uniref:Uncharacterized protein n=1 Tax=Clytia hemisphaerica TaxID=252671 RepID=A0A7M5TRE8_9CNID